MNSGPVATECGTCLLMAAYWRGAWARCTRRATPNDATMSRQGKFADSWFVSRPEIWNRS